jgi:hypothetical protein
MSATEREARKEKENENAITQYRSMLSQWEHDDGEFRNYTRRKAEILKMIGGANATGLLAIAVFLTSANRAASLVAEAKWCLALFVGGFATFIVAYRYFYVFESDLEDALILIRSGKKPEDTKVGEFIERAITRSDRGVLWAAAALGLFLLGAALSCIGLLTH